MHDSFVHLRVHSDFTLSRGASKVGGLVAAAKAHGMPAFALTDECNMFGAMSVSTYAAKAGIQPIVGTKLWVDLGEGRKGSLVLIARTERGYANVCTILAASNRPVEGATAATDVLDTAVLEERGLVEDVFALTGGRDGCLNVLLAAGGTEDAGAMLEWLRMTFPDRLYVEVCRYGDESREEVDLEERLLDLAFTAPPMALEDGTVLGHVPVVATSEVWYATEDRHDAFEILSAVERKKGITVQEGHVVPTTGRRYHMRSPAEMREIFADLPEAYDNAVELARRCAFMVKGRKPILPPFTTEGGRTEAEELRIQAREGLVQRMEKLGVPEGDERAPYEERLEYELGVIERMQFPGYFLIVSDFIKWAKAQGIPVGPGRGSGAGSLVAYSLQITDLEPMRFGLLFERFLNPDRVSMPDFDIDFCQDRREEVIEYVRKKYGTDYVSLIATFGEIKSKNALKDVGRVLQSDDFGGFGFFELNELTKIMPMDGATPKALKAAYDDAGAPEFRQKIQSEPKYRSLYENALKVEGLYRTQGAHAAGVVISGEPLHTLVPVGWDSDKGMPVSQFNMKDSESAGLVKFDFLGLKTLSIIRESLEHIRDGLGEDVDLSLVPLDDPETYAMLADGLTNNVFQFESQGMKKWMTALKPNRFEDLIAMAALYRPGPMDMIPQFVACKHGDAEPDYPKPVDRTTPVLAETFGIMVYQEQVMQVAQVVAGYSLGEADLLRRAMGKKIKAEMDLQRVRFVDGAVKEGLPERDASSLFDLLAKFADYGFNKSHAAAYALIAYHTAWLKAHYPAQFFAAVLTYESGDAAKMSKVKEDMDLERFSIEMLAPCVNASGPRFKPERKSDGSWGIRFGLAAIKGVSGDLRTMIEARRARPFAGLEDFHERAGGQFNKSQLEKLAEAGAFDTIAKNRYSAVNVLGWLAKGRGKGDAAPDLFGGALVVQVPKHVSDVPEWGNVVDREFNAVGFYFRSHPLDAYERRLIKARVKRKASLYRWMVDNGHAELKAKRLAGLVERVDRRTSKRSGKPYLSAQFSEKLDSFDTMFFSDDAAEIDQVRVLLENAKLGRRPVIVTADVVVQDGREGLTVWGRKFEDAEEVLAGERGAMLIALRPEAVILSLDEQREVREVQEARRRGASSDSELAAAEAEVREAAYARKVREVNGMVAEVRNDADPKGVEVAMSVIGPDGEEAVVTLEGRYVFGVAAENKLKSTDGVTSVSERV